MKKQKGFTLIELLVVIAIIGLLSTLAIISLNNARGKARDAKRISDIKQISTLIEMEAANSQSGGYDDGVFTSAACAAAGDSLSAAGCTIGLEDVTGIVDPTEKGAQTTICANGVADTCDYALSLTPTEDAYEICFYLEEGTAGFAAQEEHRIGAGGIIDGAADCNNDGVVDIVAGTAGCCN